MYRDVRSWGQQPWLTFNTASVEAGYRVQLAQRQVSHAGASRSSIGPPRCSTGLSLLLMPLSHSCAQALIDQGACWVLAVVSAGVACCALHPLQKVAAAVCAMLLACMAAANLRPDWTATLQLNRTSLVSLARSVSWAEPCVSICCSLPFWTNPHAGCAQSTLLLDDAGCWAASASVSGPQLQPAAGMQPGACSRPSCCCWQLCRWPCGCRSLRTCSCRLSAWRLCCTAAPATAPSWQLPRMANTTPTPSRRSSKCAPPRA